MEGKSARRPHHPPRRTRQAPLLTVTPVRGVRTSGSGERHRLALRCFAADHEPPFEDPPEGVLPTGADAHRGVDLLPKDDEA